jgi:endonuclease/exonuclease/phosphatase family metal-dependent hydrolase
MIGKVEIICLAGQLSFFEGFIMRFLRMLLLQLVMTVSAAAWGEEPATATAADSRPVRVMSFNIRYQNENDGKNGWEFRREDVAGVFRFHHVDAAGLQEAVRSQIDDLTKQLPEYAWLGAGRLDGKDEGEFTPILYRRDRLELLESGTSWLSETPEIVGSKGWDAALPRILTFAKFKDRQTGREWYLFNTHFDHVGVKARDESARLLRQAIGKLPKDSAVVAMGDFNCMEDSSPYKVLIEAKPSDDAEFNLRDARYCSATRHHGPGTTWNGFYGAVPGQKIDHIFVNQRISVLQHGILTDQLDDRFISDHFPVLAEISTK